MNLQSVSTARTDDIAGSVELSRSATRATSGASGSTSAGRLNVNARHEGEWSGQDAYRNGLAIVLQTEANTLGWAMEETR